MLPYEGPSGGGQDTAAHPPAPRYLSTCLSLDIVAVCQLSASRLVPASKTVTESPSVCLNISQQATLVIIFCSFCSNEGPRSYFS